MAVETVGNFLKGDVEWVRDEMRRMQCFRIRNWISEIREVGHREIRAQSRKCWKEQRAAVELRLLPRPCVQPIQHRE